MACDAGVLTLTLEYAKDLKDKDWFGKQDPYCVVRVGGQTHRSHTHVDGGRNPVWKETIRFNILNENEAEIILKDEDVGKDDVIGMANISLVHVRQTGTDRVVVPVALEKRRKQQGFISVPLTWTPHRAAAQGYQPPAASAAPLPLPAAATAAGSGCPSQLPAQTTQPTAPPATAIPCGREQQQPPQQQQAACPPHALWPQPPAAASSNMPAQAASTAPNINTAPPAPSTQQQQPFFVPAHPHPPAAVCGYPGAQIGPYPPPTGSAAITVGIYPGVPMVAHVHHY